MGGVWLHVGMISAKSIGLWIFALNPRVNQAGVVEQKAQSPISVGLSFLGETWLVNQSQKNH
jgi:hypothetical protein